MSKALYTDTSEVSFPTAVYPDPLRVIRQYRSNLEQGFQINNINFLNNIEDQKSNNFSINYITPQSKLTDLVNTSQLKTVRDNIITRLEFYKEATEIDSEFLYVFKDPDNNTVKNTLPVGLERITTGAYSSNYFFEIEFVDNSFLRIKHNDGTYNYVLRWDDINNVLGFSRIGSTNLATGRVSAETSDLFRYNYTVDGGRLYLFKRNPADGVIYMLTGEGDDITMKAIVGRSLDTNILNSIFIEDTFEDLIQVQNNNFISYKTGFTNNLTIDPVNSIFDQDGQYIFHIEYNDQHLQSGQVKFNFFTLDTSRSEYGYIKRGTSMTEALNTIPTFKQRNYTTLDTGNSEEGGHDKMSLVYNFYDKDIYIPNDTTTAFNAGPSLYPFEKLNINDTSFVKNGAFSGPGPDIADKIFIKQDQPEQYKNGRYLCTWLSAGDANTTGVWVDRYYYPDVLDKYESLEFNEKYSSSFNNNVDSDVTDSDAVRIKIDGFKYFDKRSDAVITPNCLVRYERIGANKIRSVVNSSSPILSSFDSCITSKSLRNIDKSGEPYLGGITENFCKDINSSSLSFDGTFYSKLNVYEQINDEKEFTISFDAYIDPKVSYGFELLGNNTNTGFGLFQDMTVTPFLHVAGGSTLQIYNTDSVLLNIVKFDDQIKDVFKRSALQDFIVTCTNNRIYRVDLKGNKIKLEIDSGIFNYINHFMTETDIYFLLKGNVVKKLNLNTLEITDEVYQEFEEYSQVFGPGEWYENLLVYNNIVYLLPGNDDSLVWEDEDTVFYTIKAGGAEPGWYVIKHNLKTYPEKFIRSDAPITDKTITFSDDVNSLVLAIGNKLYQYNTAGLLIDTIDYDTPGLWEVNLDADDQEEDSLVGGKILAVDNVNEYVTGGVNSKSITILFADKNGILSFNEPKELVTQISDITEDSFIKTPITNHNVINRIYDSKTLDFRLTLKNEYNSEDIRSESIGYDLNRIDVGVHTFTFSFNSLKGRATLFVDGLLYEDRVFDPGKYNLHNIFSDELYVGSAGFVNGIDLSTYLKQPGYYYVKDLTISNMFVYNKSATNELIYALNLLGGNVDELVLSLPHGQRNNKATIERFYKLGRHNSSKKIDVVVNNFNITDADIQNQIKLNILEDASNILPVGVEINNIKFKQ